MRPRGIGARHSLLTEESEPPSLARLHQECLSDVEEEHEFLVVVAEVAKRAEEIHGRVQPRAPRRLGVTHHLPRRLLGEGTNAVLSPEEGVDEIGEGVRAEEVVGVRVVGVAAAEVLELRHVVRVARVVQILDDLEEPREGVLARERHALEGELRPRRVSRANGVHQLGRRGGVLALGRVRGAGR